MSILAPLFFSLSTITKTHNSTIKLILLGFIILLSCAFGDTLDYFIGRFATNLLAKSKKYTNLLKKANKSITFFHKHGAELVITVSCIPVLHSSCSYIAGITKYSFKKFILANTFANVCIILLCFIMGRSLSNIPFVKAHLLLIIALVLTTFYIIIFSIKYYLNKKDIL